MAMTVKIKSNTKI